MGKKTASDNSSEEGVKLICSNKRARANYEITETYEAGIELLGTEVKSLREGGAHLTDAYVSIDNREAFVVNMHIAAWKSGGYANHEPERRRKLLLHKLEINRLKAKIEQRGLSLIPLRAYFKNGRAKLELGLGKGRKAYDKRQAIRERDEKRISDRQEKDRRR